MTKRIKLPAIDVNQPPVRKTLPYNGSAVKEKGFSFSFSCFDRTHKLFNLGDNNSDGVVSGKWFLDLVDCLKSVSNQTIPELRVSTHDLHPVDWSSANTDPPEGSEQQEYWQFRINKSRGRVIGFLIDDVFYIVWLDPHHNLTNSEGYGGIKWFHPGKSVYESQEETISELNKTITEQKEEIATYEELLQSK